MLTNALLNVINPQTVFFKANGTVAPYTFHDWSKDNSQFRYTVRHASGHTNKRVIVSELRSLLEHCLIANQNTINRVLYKQYCSTIDRDGWCGYPVVGNAIQLIKVGTFGPGGVIIHDRGRLAELFS